MPFLPRFQLVILLCGSYFLPALATTVKGSQNQCGETLILEKKPEAQYQQQDRGDLSSYLNYFAGMEKTTRQKLGLTTSIFPTGGKVADMGSGSGQASYDLARVYPHLQIIGVDINPTSVKIAEDRFPLANLKFEVGDIAAAVFPANSLDGILNSSVLHHVSTFTGYSNAKIFEALDHQVSALRERGVLVIRDFVVPHGPDKVLLSLPTNDGKKGEIDLEMLSSADLFLTFARDFKSSIHPQGVKYEEKAPNAENRRRFLLDLRTAAEFVLKKDYRRDWEQEILEEYTYFNQKQFEDEFRKRGMRIVVSKPIWNPWIVKNRFENHFELLDPKSNQPLPWVPTNYLIIGEKVPEKTGVQFRETNSLDQENLRPRFLKQHSFRHKTTGEIWNLVERPQSTVDLLPWYRKDGTVFIQVRQAYPRPIITAGHQPALNQAHYSGHMTEPLSAIVPALPADPKQIEAIYRDNLGAQASPLRSVERTASFLPSPGGLLEEVETHFLEIEAPSDPSQRLPNLRNLGYSDAGFIANLDARQVQQAFAVGGMFDARLEIALYQLLLKTKEEPHPWIGAEILPNPLDSLAGFTATKAAKNAGESRMLFEKTEADQRPWSYLSLRRSRFEEENARGEVIAARELEYVTPKSVSRNTIAVLPYFSKEGEIFVGMEDEDLPSIQVFYGSSRYTTFPAYRIPLDINNLQDAERWVAADALPKVLGSKGNGLTPLGGEFFCSPGVTNEIIFAYALPVDSNQVRLSKLKWYSLKEVMATPDFLRGLTSRTMAYRLAHALNAL